MWSKYIFFQKRSIDHNQLKKTPESLDTYWSISTVSIKFWFHQVNMDPVYDTPSAVAEGEPSGHQDNLHYSTIHFSQNQGDALYSNIGPGQLYGHKDEEASEAEYTAVKCDNSSRVQGWETVFIAVQLKETSD